MKIKIVKMHKDAKLPEFAYNNDAGADLFTPVCITIPAHGSMPIPLGISIAIPNGYVGLVQNKSKLASKYGLINDAGIIDSGYTGEIHAIIINSTNSDHVFGAGEKVAQILFQKVEHPEFIVADELKNTERGSNGFGSTGK